MKDEEEVIENEETIEVPAFQVKEINPDAQIVEEPTEIFEEVKTEEPKQEEVKTEEPKVEEKPTYDDEVIFKVLKEKGIEATNYEDLKPKEQPKLDPETEKFLEYKKETGRSFKDFLETQKDWTAEPKENILMQNLRLENPTLNDKQINRLFEKEYAFDPELDDDDVIMDKEINIERDYQKAIKLLESQKEKYMVRKGLDESVPTEFKEAKQFVDNLQQQQKDFELLVQEVKNDHLVKTEKVFNPSFEGFKFKTGDEKKGFTEVVYKPDNIEEAKTWHSDINNLNQKFFDQTGKVKNDDYYAIAEIARVGLDKFVQHITNTALANKAIEDDKLSKNIKTDTVIKPINQGGSGGGGGYTVKVIES